jgi:hypothetical protein
MRAEQQIQRAIVQHLRQRAAPGVVFLHVPNGGWRKPVEAAIFKGLGVRRGASDLLLWHAGRSYALELKAVGGRATDDQLKFLDDMDAAGALTALVTGLDAALHTLQCWGLLRGAVT